MNLQINIFTKKRSSLIEKSLRFHIVSGFDRKIYSKVFWRENTTEKKVCAFVVSGVDRKNTLSLLTRKTYIALRNWFSLIKSQVYFLF